MDNDSSADLFSLVPCTHTNEALIDEYRREFLENGEECSVLWRLSDICVSDWIDEISSDRSTMYFAFFVNGVLAGVCRVTPNPKHEANGMLGYAIRPSMRGRHLGTIMVSAVCSECMKIGVYPLTACVDYRNVCSIRTLERAGFHRTCRIFNWRPNPEPRIAIEFCS